MLSQRMKAFPRERFFERKSIMRLSSSSVTTTLASVLPLAFADSEATDIAKRKVLDSSNYKNTTVSRGIRYSYHVSPPTNNQSSIVFLHGSPGLSFDWRFQVDFFKDAGYNIIVPDMLGYGAPTDPKVYKSSLIARDIQNIATKAIFGCELFGYWELFSRPGAPELLGGHLESLLSLAHPADPADWIAYWAPLGALEAYVKQDGKPVSTVSTPEEAELYLETYSALGALEASLSWYKVAVSDIEAKDHQGE
ncbi:hypothetical protein V5O48_013759 [Marasmius crinis-equi]|uniref:AB hydrolase-1 domain-containing protein n=1 Tax=Marasmius crinis-equi TaxID=585013 RepID=A0ABR3EZ69_9AGAR